MSSLASICRHPLGALSAHPSDGSIVNAATPYCRPCILLRRDQTALRQMEKLTEGSPERAKARKRYTQVHLEYLKDKWKREEEAKEQDKQDQEKEPAAGCSDFSAADSPLAREMDRWEQMQQKKVQIQEGGDGSLGKPIVPCNGAIEDKSEPGANKDAVVPEAENCAALDGKVQQDGNSAMADSPRRRVRFNNQVRVRSRTSLDAEEAADLASEPPPAEPEEEDHEVTATLTPETEYRNKNKGKTFQRSAVLFYKPGRWAPASGVSYWNTNNPFRLELRRSSGNTPIQGPSGAGVDKANGDQKKTTSDEKEEDLAEEDEDPDMADLSYEDMEERVRSLKAQLAAYGVPSTPEQ